MLNLATNEATPGPRLPAGAARGCAAFDPNSGYVYYVEGFRGSDGNDDEGVHRMPGERL